MATTQASVKPTAVATCVCGKICKNPRGLKIHQTKMGCLASVQPEQRARFSLSESREVPARAEPYGPQQPHSPEALGETQEERGQESPHSAQNLRAQVAQAPDNPQHHRRVKWPPASKVSEWQQLDEDLEGILESTAKGGVDRKLQTMTTLVISFATERYGTMEKRAAPEKYTKNRRAEKISQLRQELRVLKKQFKGASEDQKPGLAELRCTLRKKLLTLRRAEWHRRRAKERAKKRAAFLANPFGFTKQLLGQKRSAHLECAKEEVDSYLHDTFSDAERENSLGECRVLISPPEPACSFNTKAPTWKEIQTVVRAARNNSAPGPNGVPYLVYKRCPKLLARLWKILRVIWRRGKVAHQWRWAEGVWVPKEEKSTLIEQFRTISLLNVEGKIFFSILSHRLSDFLLKNQYIDSSVQKGGIPGVPGCLEHCGVVTQLIREAREGRGSLAVLWLDLANAYGSIPHKLVEMALARHHVPGPIKTLIMDYYDSFHLRVTSGSVTSEWHRLEKGIITGCTISVIIFALAMNMLAKSAEPECRGPITKSGIRQPPIRAFMDDLTVTTTSVPGCRWILQGLERLMTWARMRFKPGKSRSLVLKAGKVTDRFRFYLGGTQIPSVSEKPVKSLGKMFDGSLKDAASIRETNDQLGHWLTLVDKSGLPGKFKAWVYQHGILPRILWPLLVYEFPISTVEGLERRVSSCLRRWLGLPRSLSSNALYGNNNKLTLPFSSLAEEFMVTRAREVLQYRESKDPKVALAGIEVRTGRRWRAQEAVDQAESRLHHKELVGAVATGRAGLGTTPTTHLSRLKGKERRDQVQLEVRASIEEQRASQWVGLRQQGAWTRWEEAMARKISWPELWRAEPLRIRFLIQSVYDVLPSPSNLFLWGKVESPSCPLCQGRGTLEHILSSCPKALGEGRYRWRHDQVLKAIAESISSAMEYSKRLPLPGRGVRFVRAGEQPPPQPRAQPGLLATARDWQLRVDLGKQLKFPENIVETNLRPDIVLHSQSSKQVILLELTVPWEERMEEAYERKAGKYAELVEDCRRAGWRSRCLPIEVGGRGFAGKSLCKAFSLLGITGMRRRKAICAASEAAERASRWLWIQRDKPWTSASWTQAGN
uniref:Polyprotein n=1 Tax=Tetraodon nigroviridis TaxID=99883 RepID=Q7T1J8_TETNG|nr:polyprotein [Tetraodon nigroviridis]